MKSDNRTWRQHYAPIIQGHIKRITAETPDITAKRLRYMLGRLNPGQYGHMKRIWGSEATRHVEYWKKGISIRCDHYFKKQKSPPDGQLGLF